MLLIALPPISSNSVLDLGSEDAKAALIALAMILGDRHSSIHLP
jgi:hypothetical protein